jgi:branched-chain amino acid transport system permease protein
MTYFLQQVVNGLQLGFVYALIALGYTMVYGVLRLINFAHADVFMVGAFLSYYIITLFHLGFIPAVITSIVGCAILGVIIERIAYKPLRNAPRVSSLVTALSMSIFLEYFTALGFVFGPDYISYKRPIKAIHWDLGGIRITNILLIVIGASILMIAFLYYIVHQTKMGKAMRAVAYDMDTARLMGINVDSIISLTFAIGSGMAGVGAVLYCLAYPQIWTFMGIMPGIKAFTAAVLGGIGNLAGAFVGSLIMGQIEILTTGFIPSGSILRDAICCSVLIFVLIIKPTGLFGKRE